MSFRILLTGASGLLGSALLKVIATNHRVVGTYYQKKPVDQPATIKIDFTDREATRQLFENNRFDLVINCAGAGDVDRAEQDHNYADLGNIQIVENLLAAVRQHSCRIIHISTDYVFSGKDGPAEETQSPEPINYYGRTKLHAEQLIRSSDVDATIIRVCSLYSIDLSATENIYKGIVDRIRNGEKYYAANDLFSNPTEVNDLAQAIGAIIVCEQKPELIHLASPEYVSRYQFAIMLAEREGFDSVMIEPISITELKLAALRPLQGGLKSSIAKAIIGRELRVFKSIR